MSTLRYGREIRWLFQTAMVVFVVTIGMGMARGLGVITDFDDSQAFTHFHSGAVGWATLGILAAVLWLFGGTAARQGEERFVTWTTVLFVVATPIFVVGWWSGNWAVLSVGGSLLLLGSLGFAWWLVTTARRIGYSKLTVPQLGALLGVLALIVGTFAGVLIAVGKAIGASDFPNAFHSAHAQTQELTFVVLLAMSLAYWRLRGDDRTRGGLWMVWLFFIGGAIVTASLLAGAVEGSVAYIPLHIAAFVILLVIGWRAIAQPGWFAAGSARHYAIAVPFAIASLALIIYLILGVTVLKLFTIDALPDGPLFAQTHVLFVGAVTNLLFGLMYDLNRAKRAIWPWADHVLFWGMNAAVAAFAVALLFDAEDLFKVITPILGIAILVGLAVHSMRMWSPAAETAAITTPAAA